MAFNTNHVEQQEEDSSNERRDHARSSMKRRSEVNAPRGRRKPAKFNGIHRRKSRRIEW
jgi:hypothetical protein